ncbi:MAG: YciI family protein [Thermoprotei archaeon]
MLVCELTTYRSLPSPQIREEHIAYLRSAGTKGKVVLSGRFADAKGALIIWRVNSLQEAEELAKGDPYYRAGLIDYQLREWNLSLKFPENLE